MYMNTGYIHDALTNVKDKSQPLSIRSCGNYRLDTQPKLPTYRPKGRLDYQIIYITSGVGHFHFDTVENETIVTAGNIVLFRPKELQKYEYYGADKPEVYWIHFTGYDVKNILRRYGSGMISISSGSALHSNMNVFSSRSFWSWNAVSRIIRSCSLCCLPSC